MKTFEEFNQITNESRMSDTFKEMNQDRIGKTMLTKNGKEVRNSIVLSEYSYAVKEGNEIVIHELDWLGDNHSKVVLYKGADKILKGFL